MQIKEINKEEYRKIEEKYKHSSFLQSTEMEAISNLKNNKSIYVGFYENGNLIGASRIICYKYKFNKYIYYAVRGPLIDYQNNDIVVNSFKCLKNYLKKKDGYMLKIDPPVIYKERDIDGNIVSGGENNENLVSILKSVGFKHQGFNNNYDFSKQNRWEFILNLKNKSIDEIYSGLKPNHRNIISKTKGFAIKIEKLSYDDLYIYKNITEDTALRRGFSDLSLEYYQTIYNNFVINKNGAFLVAYLYPREYIRALNEQLDKARETYVRTQNSKASVGAKVEAKALVEAIRKRIDEAKEYKDEKIPLAGALFIVHNNIMYYMASGSYAKYMKMYAQYAIQWHAINHAIENGIKKYNFMGITGNFDKKDPEYGVYEFKKGFGGTVNEYIGEFHLPLSPYYYLSQIKRKLKRK